MAAGHARGVTAESRTEITARQAGHHSPATARTRESVDRGFAQNILGAFLLTRLLEERILASAGDRGRVGGAPAAEERRRRCAHAPRHRGPASGQRPEGHYQMRSYQTAKLAVTREQSGGWRDKRKACTGQKARPEPVDLRIPFKVQAANRQSA
jgi:NAD(P)-dependent dehydrogenase (short-subunit alcohol dehydrogenase family)